MVLNVRCICFLQYIFFHLPVFSQVSNKSERHQPLLGGRLSVSVINLFLPKRDIVQTNISLIVTFVMFWISFNQGYVRVSCDSNRPFFVGKIHRTALGVVFFQCFRIISDLSTAYATDLRSIHTKCKWFWLHDDCMCIDFIFVKRLFGTIKPLVRHLRSDNDISFAIYLS